MAASLNKYLYTVYIYHYCRLPRSPCHVYLFSLRSVSSLTAVVYNISKDGPASCMIILHKIVLNAASGLTSVTCLPSSQQRFEQQYGDIEESVGGELPLDSGSTCPQIRHARNQSSSAALKYGDSFLKIEFDGPHHNSLPFWNQCRFGSHLR